jgi:ribosome-associated translation inhibitor RaiA
LVGYSNFVADLRYFLPAAFGRAAPETNCERAAFTLAATERTAMQISPEIAFHNIDSSDWAEDEIRSRIAKLERIYDRLTTCRVRVDQRNTNSAGTIPPVVHIEMSIPGYKDLVVSHEPDHLQQKFQAPDLRNAINEAFRIAEDQLVEFKTRRQGRTKQPQTSSSARSPNSRPARTSASS